jgi:ubiquinone/menaquinone biosynthesis C-methylase UbiE
MTSMSQASTHMGQKFSENYWEKWPELYEALVRKYEDRNYLLKGVEQTNPIHRAVLAFDYLKEMLPAGARLVDMACGIGFSTCFANVLGFDAIGYDASEKGIERARDLAKQLGQDPNMFILGDQTYLASLADNSIDAAMAMGYFRYLPADQADYCYREVFRALKPGGIFVVTNQNKLFEAFALNDGALKFWADLMADTSDVEKLLGGKSILQSLTERITGPTRKFDGRSVSKEIEPYTENPLTFAMDVAKYGYRVDRQLYPDVNLLPSFLESELDQKALYDMKSTTCLKHAEDWRGALMDYEFMGFLVKPA